MPHQTATELNPHGLPEGIRARRNLLIGYWAAERLSMGQDDWASVATAIHKADHDEQGDENILRWLRAEFSKHNTAYTEAEFKRVFSDCHKRALGDARCTD